MKKISLILTVIFSSLILVSCSGSSGGGSDPAPQEEEDTGGTTGGTSGGTTGGTSGGTTGGTSGGSTGGVDVTIDSELTKAELSKLNASLKLIESLQIDGSRISGFSQIFGGTRSSNVVKYFENRINYVISQNTDYRTRLVLASLAPLSKLGYYAANPSVFIWYISLFNEPEDVRFKINNRLVDITSTRIGVMQLGDIFTTEDTISDAITLIHEARHSDCPEGALASEVLRFYNGLSVIDHTCGQLHGSCAGGGSCDVIPWGPYAIDYIYSLAIERTCTSCTQTEIQQARVNANYVQGAAFEIQATMNGDFGSPDMRNSNQVRNDL
jgi:hypothetical protein